MAYYLKYRPQTFSELDLPEVRDGLLKIVSSKEFPHAFLFAGPRGMGKTSAARIVAKAVNCERRASQGNTSDGGRLKRSGSHDSSEVEELASEPCNQCDSCLSITAGINLDVLEIDAASNRGIEDIRTLREAVKLTPLKNRFKVYIIDEAHMLTGEAFNALLKTLEEPPKHAIFILCTTALRKLPETIISRCLVFNFRRAKKEELVESLEEIVKKEELSVTPGALAEIAKAGEGSFRDAQKLLEQVAAGEEKIDEEKVKKSLRRMAAVRPEKLLDFLVEKETAAAISEIGRAVEEGADLSWYCREILEILRAALLAKFGVKEERLVVDEETEKKLQTLTVEQIKELISLFSIAAVGLADAVVPQLPLEMAAVEWCQKNEKLGEVEKAECIPSNPSFSSFPSGSNPTFDLVCQKWSEIVKEVGPKNHSVQAFLRAARPKDFDGETLVLEVFYSFHKSQLETEKCRGLVEEVASLVLQTPVKLQCILGQKQPLLKEEKKEDNKEGEDIIKVAEEIFGKKAE